MKRILVISLLAFGIPAAAHAQQALSAEPPPGQLSPGQIVFVDDGTCGKGKIKKVTGGNHRVNGVGSRTRECIADPRLKGR